MATVNSPVRFETRDIAPRKVFLTGIGIFVGTVIVAALMYVLYVFIAQARERAGPLPASVLPPEPRLQAAPRDDFQDYRNAQLGQLNSYQWIDRNKGVVGIPIQRAMQLIAQRGIPPQKTPADLKLYPPEAGTRRTGFEGKVRPEPR